MASRTTLAVYLCGILVLQLSVEVYPGSTAIIPPPVSSVFIFQSNSDDSSSSVHDINKEVRQEDDPKPNRVLLNDIINTDVEIEPGKNVEMECQASYPVQWNYKGPGRPQFTTTVTTDMVNNKEFYKASLFISNANSKDTGLYVCSYAEFSEIHSSYHVFVPGPEIFVGNSGRGINYSSKMHHVIIPCPVSVKKAKVILRKVYFDNSLKNIEPPLAIFDPKVGFKLNIRELRDSDGTYICSGTYDGHLRLREFTLRNQDRNVTSVTFPDGLPEDINPCLSYSCPSRSLCRVNLNTNLPFCACRSKISSSIDTNCTRLCKTSHECPKSEKCQFHVEKQLKMCVHVCQDHSCGENADCAADEQLGGPKCKCRRGFEGNANFLCERAPLKSHMDDSSYCSSTKCGMYAKCKNVNGKAQCACNIGTVGVWPNCSPACVSDDDCHIQDKCSEKGICEHVCKENMCAPKAECKAVQRKPQCLCPPGFTGKATEACYPSHYYFSSRSDLSPDVNMEASATEQNGAVGDPRAFEVEETLKILLPEDDASSRR